MFSRIACALQMIYVGWSSLKTTHTLRPTQQRILYECMRPFSSYKPTEKLHLFRYFFALGHRWQNFFKKIWGTSMFSLWLRLSCVLLISVYTPKLLCKSTAKYRRQKIKSCQTSMMEMSAKYSTTKMLHQWCLIGFLIHTFNRLM